MAIIVRSVTNEAPTGFGIGNPITTNLSAQIPFPNGGILIGAVVSWIGNEFIDNAALGTLEQAYKPGDIGFNIYDASNSQGVGGSLFSLTYDIARPTIVQQGGTFSWRHPEYDTIKYCGYIRDLRPNAAPENFIGMISAGGVVNCASFADDVPYIGTGSNPGRHRAQFDCEFVVFE